MRSALANLNRHLSGDESGAQAYAEAVESAKIAFKAATVDDSVNETAEDSRNRRIAELLRRRQPSGLVSGSASPTPPRDSS